VQIAQRATASGLPVFVVTQHITRFDPTALGIPPQAMVRSKSTDAGWQAGDIRDELRRRGLFTNPRHVFLIYGHDRTAPGTREAVRDRYTARKIKVEMITPDSLFTEINRGLVARMHDCAAILAICTPDDKVETETETYYQPRQNVLYEIGIALGLARGPERLTILQKEGGTKKGTTPDQFARLPSDLGGIVPIRFKKTIDEVFDRLDARLVELGVALE
jgi:predicted nucleotide-binding protein